MSAFALEFETKYSVFQAIDLIWEDLMPVLDGRRQSFYWSFYKSKPWKQWRPATTVWFSTYLFEAVHDVMDVRNTPLMYKGNSENNIPFSHIRRFSSRERPFNTTLKNTAQTTYFTI